MSQVGAGSGDGESPSALDVVVEKLIALLLTIRGSFLAFMMFLGGLLFLAGLLIDPLESYGEVAAMLVIWGVTLVVYGLIGYAVMWLIGYR